MDLRGYLRAVRSSVSTPVSVSAVEGAPCEKLQDFTVSHGVVCGTPLCTQVYEIVRTGMPFSFHQVAVYFNKVLVSLRAK